MFFNLITVGISSEQDVVVVRQRARQISSLLGFGSQDQVRVTTAVSELSRNVFSYASGGRVEFAVENTDGNAVLAIRIKNTRGQQRAANMGIVTDAAGMPMLDTSDVAINSAQRLMDRCVVEDEGGRATVITLYKTLLPGAGVTKKVLNAIVGELSQSPVPNTFSEVEHQNKELLDTLAELRARQDDLLALTQELEDTNRGVVALYAEIEEKAERLRQADEMKSRFLSNTSHELRTPLSSIRALSRLLLDRIDGDLTAEQEKQVRFIEKAASDLSELVNDLLDLAKIESGKIVVNYTQFQTDELFGALRGLLRPLCFNPDVELIFEDSEEKIALRSDEGKVSQILRNFVANALKFTEQGTVRIAVKRDLAERTVRFMVSDTGIGISPENLQFIFEEFSQVESPQLKHTKGTGLGLPLCRKLATLLGGRVELESTIGAGSCFTLVLPEQPTAAGHSLEPSSSAPLPPVAEGRDEQHRTDQQ
jgi:signal transduction histidine kinase